MEEITDLWEWFTPPLLMLLLYWLPGRVWTLSAARLPDPVQRFAVALLLGVLSNTFVQVIAVVFLGLRFDLALLLSCASANTLLAVLVDAMLRRWRPTRAALPVPTEGPLAPPPRRDSRAFSAVLVVLAAVHFVHFDPSLALLRHNALPGGERARRVAVGDLCSVGALRLVGALPRPAAVLGRPAPTDAQNKQWNPKPEGLLGEQTGVGLGNVHLLASLLSLPSAAGLRYGYALTHVLLAIFCWSLLLRLGVGGALAIAVTVLVSLNSYLWTFPVLDRNLMALSLGAGVLWLATLTRNPWWLGAPLGVLYGFGLRGLPGLWLVPLAVLLLRPLADLPGPAADPPAPLRVRLARVASLGLTALVFASPYIAEKASTGIEYYSSAWPHAIAGTPWTFTYHNLLAFPFVEAWARTPYLPYPSALMLALTWTEMLGLVGVCFAAWGASVLWRRDRTWLLFLLTAFLPGALLIAVHENTLERDKLWISATFILGPWLLAGVGLQGFFAASQRRTAWAWARRAAGMLTILALVHSALACATARDYPQDERVYEEVAWLVPEPAAIHESQRARWNRVPLLPVVPLLSTPAELHPGLEAMATPTAGARRVGRLSFAEPVSDRLAPLMLRAADGDASALPRPSATRPLWTAQPLVVTEDRPVLTSGMVVPWSPAPVSALWTRVGSRLEVTLRPEVFPSTLLVFLAIDVPRLTGGAPTPRLLEVPAGVTTMDVDLTAIGRVDVRYVVPFAREGGMANRLFYSAIFLHRHALLEQGPRSQPGAAAGSRWREGPAWRRGREVFVHR